MEETKELYKFQGKGKLTLIERDNKEIDIDISLIVRYNSIIEIQMGQNDLNGNGLQLLQHAIKHQLTKCSFKGVITGNKKIEIPSFYIDKFNFSVKKGKSPKISLIPFLDSDIYIFDSSESNYKNILRKKGQLKVGLLNFIFDGKYFTNHSDGSKRRDFFKISLENKEIGFRQVEEYKEIKSILQKDKNIMITSEMEFIDSSCYEIKKMVSDILWLLSYSQKTLISRQYTKFIKDANEILLIFHIDKKYKYSNSSFIDAKHLEGDYLEQFLEETYQFFKNNEKKLKLDIIIDIICQAELATVLESKYLLMSSALELSVEMLRKENKIDVAEDKDVIENIFKAIKKYLKKEKLDLENEHINNISSKLAYKTLKNKIRAVIDYLKFSYSDSDIKRIKDNRNKIVHEVRFYDYMKPVDDYRIIKLLVDKIFIKTLGYSGKVINYTNKYKNEKIV